MSGSFQFLRIGASLDFGFDWDDGWLETGETITDSTWVIGPSGPVLSGANSDGQITAVTVTPSNSDANKTFQLTNTITSSLNISDVRAITIRVGCPVTAVEDTTPDQFTFTDVTGASLSTQYTSDPVPIIGFDADTPISVVGGTYSVNGGSYTSATGTLTPGTNNITVRRTSSGSYSTTLGVTLTVGTISDTWSVTTGPDPSVYAPSLDFSDARNSQYIVLLEDI